MKGIILAGGNGRRLNPLTSVVNKHLLPVYSKPMIYWPLETLVASGIKDILVISGREYAKQFSTLLGSGEQFGARLSYDVQDGAGGIAHALAIAEPFAGKDNVAVILGDNVFMDSREIKRGVDLFHGQAAGAKIFLKKVSDAQRFGVATLQGDVVTAIEEKPSQPKSDLAVTGMYLYDHRAFDVIRTLKPSGRGELEITDVNNYYIKQGEMTHHILGCEWTDAGTFDSLLRANMIAAGLKPQNYGK